jgi:hypothetical protein
VEDGYLSRMDVMDEITGLVDTNAPWTRNRRTRAHRVFKDRRTDVVGVPRVAAPSRGTACAQVLDADVDAGSSPAVHGRAGDARS